MINISELKESVDLRSLAEHLGLRVTRGYILCPFHNDSNATNCKLYNHNFHCFACGHGGDAIDLIEQVCGYDFEEALKYLCCFCGVLLDDEKSARRYRYHLTSDDLDLIGATVHRFPGAQFNGKNILFPEPANAGTDGENAFSVEFINRECVVCENAGTAMSYDLLRECAPEIYYRRLIRKASEAEKRLAELSKREGEKVSVFLGEKSSRCRQIADILKSEYKKYKNGEF